MMKTASYARNLLAAAAFSVAVSACVVVPGRRYSAGFVTVAPPPPRVEVYGAPPAAGYVWTGGYWRWAGNRYVWVRGRWAAPRRGYHWVPHHWAHGRGGWRFEEGHWAR